jgi:hypothetical protein
VAGTEPTSVCPLHAGSGEPSPLWNQTAEAGNPDEAIMPADPAHPLTPVEQQKQEQQRQEQRRRGNAIQRLFRRIFGQ